MDSIPNTEFFDDIILAALNKYASNNPKTTATLYLYVTQSINFHEPTYSAFVGISGPNNILSVALNAFEKVEGVRVRYSDYIRINQGQPRFQIQEGEVWQPLDAVTWFSGASSGYDDDPGENWGDWIEESPPVNVVEKVAETNSASVTKQGQGLRFRQARADASVGSIRSTIEQVFGLPEGSVQLVGPLGKILRTDAKISTLRKQWQRAMQDKTVR
jgi:hypothetical protein